MVATEVFLRFTPILLETEAAGAGAAAVDSEPEALFSQLSWSCSDSFGHRFFNLSGVHSEGLRFLAEKLVPGILQRTMRYKNGS